MSGDSLRIAALLALGLAGSARADLPAEAAARIEGVAKPMAQWRATWQLPAEYAQSIGPVSVLQVRPDIYMLTVDGVNVAVATGEQATLVIGTAPAASCKALVAAVGKISEAPIRYLVNTSGDADRMGCNEQLALAGRAFLPGALGWAAPAIAHRNVVLQLIDSGQNYPAVAFPSELFTWPEKHLYLNDQGVSIIWMPAAHSDGDSMVLFRRSDVVVAGNIFDETRFPIIDLAHGGSIQGEITALNRLLNELTFSTVPKFQRRGGTLIIPGRGQLCTQIDVLNYRDMVVVIRDRIQDLIDKGKTLDEVQASDPARGYTTRYGASSGPWTTQDFIAAVYQSLKAGNQRAAE